MCGIVQIYIPQVCKNMPQHIDRSLILRNGKKVIGQPTSELKKKQKKKGREREGSCKAAMDRGLGEKTITHGRCQKEN